MPGLTVKNLPDHLYEKLKASAAAHHRSINGELICCLELVLMPRKVSAAERIRRARALRPEIERDAVNPAEIFDAIRHGRP